MRVYYAHCTSIYNTPTEQRDMMLLQTLFPYSAGYVVTNPNGKSFSEGYLKEGMEFFHDYLKNNNVGILVFRGLPNGKIPSGVYKEIMWAKELGITIIELPCFTGREMSLDDTRLYLQECGYR